MLVSSFVLFIRYPSTFCMKHPRVTSYSYNKRYIRDRWPIKHARQSVSTPNALSSDFNMQLSTVVFALVVLAAVLVKSGEARASPSKEELLDDLTDRLLARYLESREQDKGVQNANTRDGYKDGPVRRWWWKKPDTSKNNADSESKSEDTYNNNNNQGNDCKK
ncbi:uncharacterized protein LOC123540581 [Mercenaria mercenaria]|uniref:uncharacterized protein LOC123540581 n=1 Tax=Mercenaria mercenaria TaxID=6596 RepID=UPI00234F8FCD|nr:uncharacterized protein LOC123540581 [Mercenaria mercenaria]